MMKRFFRRRSLTERELQKDYPTNSDSDDVTDEETRRKDWQKHLNRRASDRMDDFSDNMEGENWDYESEYNYSIQSESTVIDAYKERRYSNHPNPYSDKDLERRIEQAMRNEVMNREEQKTPRRQSDDKKDRFRTLSPVNETVRKLEQNIGLTKRRASAAPQIRISSEADRKNAAGGSNDKTINTCGKKRQRRQNKQRRRAREVDTDISDDDDKTKYAVNITMEDLNDLIKKNISTAVNSIVTKSKGQRIISPNESFSTESETIFSGSSTQSTDIPPGLLTKQIKAQLDRNKLKGMIRQAVAKETNDLKLSINEQNRVPTGPTLPDFQQAAHFNPYTTHAQMMATSSHLPSHIPPAPPLPSSVPQVTFTLPDGSSAPPPISPYNNNRRLSLAPHFQNNSVYNQDNYQHHTMMQMEQPASPFLDGIVLPPGAMNRLQNRRHTLADLSSTSGLMPSDGTVLDDKIEQFSNALKLLDKTIQKAEGGSSKDKKTAEDNIDSADRVETVVNPPQVQNVSELGNIATIPGGIFAPVMSVADQIKALSNKKKEKKPLKPGELEMSSCARTFLILSNMIFLIAGGGVCALGVWLMMDPNIETYFHIINIDKSSSDFKMICYGLIAIGVFALAIAFMGCCGAIQRSKCMLTMFIVMVGVLTLLEAGLGAMLMMNQDSPTAIPVLSALLADMENFLKTQLKTSLVTSYFPDTTMGSTWDLVQIHLECCGATGAEDYKISKWMNETRPETEFPDTCCVLVDKEAEVPEPSNKLLCHFGTAGFYFETGCFDKMIGWFKDNSMYIIIAATVVVATEIVAFLSAFVICRKAVKAEKRKKAAKQNASTNATNANMAQRKPV